MSIQAAKRFAGLLLLALAVSSPALAIKVGGTGDDFALNVNVLMQARAQGDWDGPAPTLAEGASPGGGFNTDYYLRRARLIASGTAYKYVNFSIMLDTPQFGRRGSFAGSTFVQDLVIGFKPIPELIIETGFLFMPFAHQAMATSGQASALESPATIVFYNNARGSRETGVQIRSLLLGNRLLIRGGVYEGAHGDPAAAIVVNPRGRPLFGGVARLNLIGEETGYSYPPIYMDGKSRVSVGFAAQYQNKGSNIPRMTFDPKTKKLASVGTGLADYVALSADLNADLALAGDTEAVFQLTGYRFDYGPGSDKTGFGISGEGGYRLGQFEPEANFYYFKSASRLADFQKIAVGANYFLKGHQVKLTGEFASVFNGVEISNTPSLKQIVGQAQVYF